MLLPGCLVIDAIRPYTQSPEESVPDPGDTDSGEVTSGPEGSTGPSGPSGPSGMPSGPVTGITVGPSGTTVGFAKSLQMTAVVTGGNNAGVTWSFVGDGGGATLSASGLFTAPLYEKSYVVDGASVEDPSIHASVTVTVALSQLVFLAGGLGGPGYADGLGAEARFRQTGMITIGPGGDYYLTDSLHAIRRITPNGEVTTISGSPYDTGSQFAIDAPAGGSGARFADPTGIVGYSGDTLFVADTGHFRVRKLVQSGANWLATTLAGGTSAGIAAGTGASARFTVPEHLALDAPHGLLILSENINPGARITQIDIATGFVTTICTNAQQAYVAQLVVDPIRQQVIAPHANSDEALRVVARWNGTSYDCVLPAGAAFSTTHIVLAAGIAWFGAKVFATDYSMGQVLQSPDTSGVPAPSGPFALSKIGNPDEFTNESYDTGEEREDTTGPGPGALRNPIGLAITPDGTTAIVAESQNHKVRALRLSDGHLTSIAGRAEQTHFAQGFRDAVGANARFSSINGMTADGNGNLWVLTDVYASPRVRKIPLDGSMPSTITLPSNMTPRAIAYDALADELIISSCGNNRTNALYFVAPVTGEFGPVPATVNAVLGSTGNTTSGYVDDATGVNNAAVRVYLPAAIAVAPSGEIYLADEGNNVIRRIQRQGGVFLVDTFQGTAGMVGSTADTNGLPDRLATFAQPAGLAVFGNYLFVSDLDTFTIRRIDLTTRDTIQIAGSVNNEGQVDGSATASRFMSPEHLAVDGAGVLYVSSRDSQDGYGGGTGLVRMIRGATTPVPTVQVSTIAGDIVRKQRAARPGPLPSILNMVFGLAMTPSGDLAVASENSILLIR